MTVTYRIYCHTCTVTGKSYVGMTKKTIVQRWNEHVALAYDNRERSKYRKYHFQSAIKFHGVENWTHRLLSDHIQSFYEACDVEKFFIHELMTLSPNGYNETLGGAGVLLTVEGKKRHRLATREALQRPDVRERYLDGIRASHSTESFLLKNRVAQKIAQNRPDVSEKKRAKMLALCSTPGWVSSSAKRVQQITKSGEIIAEFESAKIASRATGINYTKITEVARGNRKYSGGFRWKYLDLEKNDV